MELRPLDLSALDYVNEALSGGRTLSALLGERNLRGGRVYAFVPASLDDDRTMEFHEGGIYPANDYTRTERGGWILESVPEYNRTEFNKLLRVRLGADSTAMCLFEHPWASPTDGWLQRVLDSSWRFYRNEVYLIVRGSNVSSEAAVGAMRHFPSRDLICAVTEMVDIVDDSSSLDRVDLERVAQTASTIILGAYDGEGMVVWSDRASPF